MRLRLVLVAGLVAAVVLPAAALGRSSSTKTFVTKLTGGVEVPKGAPAGSGQASITITGTKVCWAFTKIKGITRPLVSHIHKGGPGKAGPVVVPLGGAFKLKGCTTTTAAIAKAIVAKPGAYYVNIHTPKFPAGAIRGQLGKAGKSTASKGGGGYGAGY